MTTVLCTLYNSLYLDKGLVLYDSLCKCSKDFKLYVLCMDDKCYEVLTDLHQEYHIPIKLSDFEKGDEELLKAKGNRSMAEYCWTCSSSLIRYVFNHYLEPICTYIDADMYFYSDPQLLVEEMINSEKSVMVTPHRFPKKNERLSQKVGIYCVEFNTFMNNSESLEVLEYWRNRCLECCSNLGDGIHWGDQKYLEELVEKFSCVHVCQNAGAGVAPWNIILYKMSTTYNNDYLMYRELNEIIPLFFYHFQSVKYVTRQIINTAIPTINAIDFSLVDSLYYPYLCKIEVKKQMLEEKYDVSYLITYHPSDKKNSKMRMLVNKIHPRHLLSVLRARIMNIRLYVIDISKYGSNIIS